MAQTVRMRFGIKAPLLPNIAIFVLHVPDDVADKLIGASMVLKALITPYNPEIAARIVCERS